MMSSGSYMHLPIFVALTATIADLWGIAFLAPFANSGLPIENYKRYAKTEATSSLALVLRNTHKKIQTSTFKNDGNIAETVKTPKKRFFRFPWQPRLISINEKSTSRHWASDIPAKFHWNRRSSLGYRGVRRTHRQTHGQKPHGPTKRATIVDQQTCADIEDHYGGSTDGQTCADIEDHYGGSTSGTRRWSTIVALGLHMNEGCKRRHKKLPNLLFFWEHFR